MALRFVYQISCNLNQTARTIQNANHFRSISPGFQHVMGYKKAASNHCFIRPRGSANSINPIPRQTPNLKPSFSGYRDHRYDDSYEEDTEFKPEKEYISNPYTKSKKSRRYPIKERLNRIASYYSQKGYDKAEPREETHSEEVTEIKPFQEEETYIPTTVSKLNLHPRYRKKKYHLEDSVPPEYKNIKHIDVYNKLSRRVVKRAHKVVPHLQPNNIKPYGSSKNMYYPPAYYSKRSSAKISLKSLRKKKYRNYEPSTAPYSFDEDKFMKRKKSLRKMSWHREYSTSTKPNKEVVVKIDGLFRRTTSFIKNLVNVKNATLPKVPVEVPKENTLVTPMASEKSPDWEKCDQIISMYKQLNPTQELTKKSYPSGSNEEKQAVEEAMDFVAKCTRNFQLERFGKSKSQETFFSENSKKEENVEKPGQVKSSINIDSTSSVTEKVTPPILSYSDMLKVSKPKTKPWVIYPNSNCKKNLYSTFYARSFATSSQSSKILMKIPHRIRGFKSSSKCQKSQVSNRSYSTFTKKFFPKSETNMQSRFQSSKKNKKHPFCGVTPFDPPPEDVDPCLPQDCVYVKKPKPLDWKLRRLKKRCKPMELKRKCPVKVKSCPTRADASMTIEKKKLPKIYPAEDCPCNPDLMKEGCPLERLKSRKVKEPKRPTKCKYIDPCPPRADAKLKRKKKRLPRLSVLKIGKTKVCYPEVELTRLCKTEVKEPKRVCPVRETCDAQTRADDGMKVKMLTLRPIEPNNCNVKRPPPLKEVPMRRLKKVTIEPPPRECPPVKVCDEMITKSDVACGYKVKEKTLKPMILKSEYNYINVHHFSKKKKKYGGKKYHTLASRSTYGLYSSKLKKTVEFDRPLILDRLPQTRNYSTGAFFKSSNFEEGQVEKKEKKVKKKLLSNLMISLANYDIARSFPQSDKALTKCRKIGNASWNYLASCLSNRENTKPNPTLSSGICQKLLEGFPLTPTPSVKIENVGKVSGNSKTSAKFLAVSKRRYHTRNINPKLYRREISKSSTFLKKKCDAPKDPKKGGKKCPAEKMDTCEKRKRLTCQNKFKFKKCCKMEAPYPSYSECGLTFKLPKCECRPSQKHLQPHYKLIPKIQVVKPPPPESDIIDIRKVKKCVLKRLDKKDEGETRTCENYCDPYKEFGGLKQLNKKMAADLKRDAKIPSKRRGKAGTKCECPVAVLKTCEDKKSGPKAPRATTSCGKDAPSTGYAPRAIGQCKKEKSRAPRAKIDCGKDKDEKPKCGYKKNKK